MKLVDYRGFVIIFTILIISSCGGGGDEPSPNPIAPVPSPTAATLIFPENNTECNTGEIISLQRSNVTFTWNESENTSSYEINLKNLNDNSILKQVSNSNEATVALIRGAPYEWFVVSKAAGTTETATSIIWKFYNEGPGISNYAPFPAEAISPTRGANLTVGSGELTLQWSASDIDNDITSYEVFLDTNENPTTPIGTTSETTLSAVSVMQGTTYRWKIITNDAANNNSSSEIFEFRVN